MSEIKRSFPPRRPRGKDKNDSLEELSKVTGFSSTVNETEVKRECEDGWNRAVDEIVKKERIEEYESESCLYPPKIQSGGSRGGRTKPMSSQTNQNEPTEGNIPKNKKRRRPRRQQLERAAGFGLTEKDLPESVQERANLLSKLRKRKMRASETPEEKAERNRRESERQRIRRANEDPEKREKRRRAQSEYKKKVMQTPERAEARRRRHCEIQRESYKRHKNSEQSETPDQREERLRKLKERQLRTNERERFKRLERKLGMTEEEKAEERARNFFKKQALEAKMTQEELEAYKERRKELSKEYFKNLSGEKLERHKANMYKAAKKFQERNKERRRRKLEEDPLYRAKVRLNYRIIQAKQKLKRDLVRDGASEEVIKEELRKLGEKMKAEPLPPPETVSEYKPRPQRRRPVEKPEPIINPIRENSFNDQNLDMEEYLQEEEDFAPPSPEAASPAPMLSPSNTDEAEEDGSEVPITSSKPAMQSPIIPPASRTVLVPAPPPLPNKEIKTTSSEDSSTQSEPTSSVHVNKATLNLNWKCPICRTVLHSKENFSEHYNAMHKTVQKQQVDPQQALSEHFRKHDKGIDKPKPSTPPLPTFICMKCPIPKQLTSGNNSFKGKGHLLAHVRQKHRKFYFPCPNCNILKYRKSALKDHLRVCES